MRATHIQWASGLLSTRATLRPAGLRTPIWHRPRPSTPASDEDTESCIYESCQCCLYSAHQTSPSTALNVEGVPRGIDGGPLVSHLLLRTRVFQCYRVCYTISGYPRRRCLRRDRAANATTSNLHTITPSIGPDKRLRTGRPPINLRVLGLSGLVNRCADGTRGGGEHEKDGECLQ